MTHTVIENGVARPATPEEDAEFTRMQTAAAVAAPAVEAAEAKAAILARLAEIDAKSVRPLRAVLAAQAAGTSPDPTDLARLDDLNAQADALRGQMNT